MPWYNYAPSGATPYNPGNPNNYTLVIGLPPTCLGVNDFLCIIQASDNLGHPIITDALKDEMLTALQNRIDTTNVLLKP